MLSDPFWLHISDLPGCLQLSEEADWNQNEADWRLILEEGRGFGIRRGTHLVASAAVMPYGTLFGWICMVLVTGAERRQGLASRLLDECIEWLRARGITAGLDATPAGREVYRQLGFREVYSITRLVRISNKPRIQFSNSTIAPINVADLPAIAAYDHAAFGEDRHHLLAAWLARAQRAAYAASIKRQVTGFVLAREGRVAAQLGPLVADDQKIAIALLQAALSHHEGQVLIDVPDRHTDLRAWLVAQGFAPQRSFTRMLLGRCAPLDRPERVMAITGPEFG